MSVTACHIFAMPASVGTILGMTVAHHRKNFLSASNSLCTTLRARANFVLAVCFKEKCSGDDPGTIFHNTSPLKASRVMPTCCQRVEVCNVGEVSAAGEVRQV